MVVAAILGVRSGAAIAGSWVAGTLVAVAFVVFRAAPRGERAVVVLAVLFLAVALVAVALVAVAFLAVLAVGVVLLAVAFVTAVLFVAVLFVAVLFVAVLFVAVARAGATFFAATVALAAVARTALTTLAAVVLAGVALAVPFEDGAVLSAGPFFFADIAFFTAILGPLKWQWVVPANADRWREDMAIPPETQWGNAAASLVSPWRGSHRGSSHTQVTQSGASTMKVDAPLCLRTTCRRSGVVAVAALVLLAAIVLAAIVLALVATSTLTS